MTTLREKLRRAIQAHAKTFPEIHPHSYVLGSDWHLARLIDPRTVENANVFDAGEIPHHPSMGVCRIVSREVPTDE